MGYKFVKHLEAAQHQRRLFYLDNGFVDLPPVIGTMSEDTGPNAFNYTREEVQPGSEAHDLKTNDIWILDTQGNWVLQKAPPMGDVTLSLGSDFLTLFTQLIQEIKDRGLANEDAIKLLKEELRLQGLSNREGLDNIALEIEEGGGGTGGVTPDQVNGLVYNVDGGLWSVWSPFVLGAAIEYFEGESNDFLPEEDSFISFASPLETSESSVLKVPEKITIQTFSTPIEITPWTPADTVSTVESLTCQPETETTETPINIISSPILSTPIVFTQPPEPKPIIEQKKKVSSRKKEKLVSINQLMKELKNQGGDK